MASKTTNPVLGNRALNRATLDRQLLLRRAPKSAMSAKGAVEHLVGLQAQNVKPPYFALAARLDGFVPEDLSALMASREVARLVTMRSTIHTHSADDCLTLRPLVQAARDRELKQFRNGLAGVDLGRLGAISRELVEEQPRTMKELREVLLKEWPDGDPFALSVAARCVLPLVQVTPRGLWGRSGQVTLTTAEHWFGRESEPVPAPDGTVLRYLAAFGPASVKDMQTWSGLTRMREVFERLRPRLAVFQDEQGVELFDLPNAPRPDADTPAPPRFLPEYDNLLLSHADRSRFVAEEYTSRTWKGNQSFSVLMVDGRVSGIWRLEESKRSKASQGGKASQGSALLTVQAFGKLTRTQREAVAEEGERILTTMSSATTHDIRFGTFSE
ncbi:winged helix DNA-binding domain-containing protein [Streptomyces lunaelactis]|uniref:winged helix DNA-binding domain-containing protein n=1 Tax=Streptomyces lunaelactis TaxID=1535768 RepID=UPI0015858837|nr:winged helix DNA-binding domain-containing protein [Streptomyces lunaelactis]NUK50823.1 winged helix DNA-binding domain-containing protein [Streptomyces lunaelactis]NUK63135.1 winged helix DNA-binding domain-containing protein [Streptomyces lunaelactis]